MSTLNDCPFCEIEKDPDQRIVFKNDLMVFCQSEKYVGALKYSGIMVPLIHRETVFDLTDEEIAASFSLLREIKKWMDREYNPDGYNVGWNCYPTGGQSIPHAHMHVMPRFKQEPLAGRGIRHHLKSKENCW